MSGNALKDLNTLPAYERKNESSSKGSFPKPYIGNATENVEERQFQRQQKNSASLVPANANGVETLNNEVETVTNGIEISSEVEYIESENLSDVEDLDSSLKTILTGLESKDWVLVCESLNIVRRLSIYHKETMLNTLGDVISLVVKSLKNPRSAVCKTAIMTSADIFNAYNEHIIDSLDPLLTQLLLKSSQDKRFVCEAAERALVAMTTWVSPVLLLPKLQPYLKNRNPRIRAKASMCYCRSVPRLGVEGIKAYGIDKLVQVAASQLSDQLPESREAARTLLLELQTVYEQSLDLTTVTVSEHPEMGSWEHFCQSKLSPLSAQAVLRVTNITRDGIVLGS
ncbi:CLASP_N domain-containing protein [Cephalotus follicularis]|uniref:CLASP_N domain-containing protein n=1 Tax=Cephalotus follicularis TaxID=3775 RepID=A0A1Q3BXF7_CEPFO|nr:CLASP_N domain-containing protein [Cephalotus follicularis]